MKYLLSHYLAVMILCILLLGSGPSCAKRPFFKPPGHKIGSCKGVMKLTNGKQTRFVLDIFKNPDGDFKLYVSLSGRGVSYEPVEDISFDNGTMRVVVGSGKKVYEGKIVGDGLKLWGEWGKYSGTFFLEIKE